MKAVGHGERVLTPRIVLSLLITWDYGLSLPATCDLQEVAISSPEPLRHSQADVQLPTLCTTGILNYATRATWHWMFSTYKHTLSVRISRVLHCRSNTRCSRVCVPANSAHDWNISSFLILRLSGIAFRTTNLNLNHPLCHTTEGITKVPRSAAD